MKWIQRQTNHSPNPEDLVVAFGGLGFNIGSVIPHLTDGTFRALVTLDYAHGAYQVGVFASMDEAKRAIEAKVKQFAEKILEGEL